MRGIGPFEQRVDDFLTAIPSPRWAPPLSIAGVAAILLPVVLCSILPFRRGSRARAVAAPVGSGAFSAD